MKLIKLKEDHYVVVDDSEIRENDLCYDPEGNPGHNNIKYVVKCLRTASDSYWNKHCKKITHSTKVAIEDYWNVIELSLSEIKELIGEVDIWQKFKEIDGSCQKGGYEHWLFESGYNQALEDNKEKKYTEEDLKRAFFNGGNMKEIEDFNYFIKSVQPKTEWQVEFINGKLKLK